MKILDLESTIEDLKRDIVDLLQEKRDVKQKKERMRMEKSWLLKEKGKWKRKFVSRGYVRFSAIVGEIVAFFLKELFYHFSRWRQVIFPEEPCQKVSIIIDIIILHREPIPILTRMKLCKKARILWHLWSTIIVISIDTTTIIAQLVKARQISIFEENLNIGL